MTPRNRLLLAIPLIAVIVVALAYYRLFTSPVVIAVIFVLWVVVSLWNKRKFARRKSDVGS